MKMLESLKRLRYHIGYYRLTKRFQKLDLPQLTKGEKALIRETWPGVHIYEMDFVHVRIYKKIHGFSPYYLSPCWYNEIRDFMNPRDQLISLENKAMCDVYFPKISFPEVFVRSLNGYLYNKEMNIISRKEAIDLLMSKGEFMIKPSIGTNQGFGVKKVSVKKGNIDIASVFDEEGMDFIVQEVLRQAPEFERLNPTSLNCFRVTTLLMNDKFGYSTCLKVGKRGAVRDNWNTGLFVNVTDEGKCSKFAYDYNMDSIDKTDNGIIFENLEMPRYQEMISYLENLHRRYFPNCAVIGWDITLDQNYKFRIIEYNLSDPGTNLEQFVGGDFFRPFQHEMLNYLHKKCGFVNGNN